LNHITNQHGCYVCPFNAAVPFLNNIPFVKKNLSLGSNFPAAMVSPAVALVIFLCLGSILRCEAEHRHKTDIEVFEAYAKNATVGPGSYQDKTTSHKYQEL
jgi:hypothetical protein